MYLKRQEQQGNVVDAAQTPPLARHVLPTSDCTLHSHENQEHMELGSLHEIDHIQLPPRTPFLLRSARVVMVSEKTELNVSVRFPSIQSLQRYFNNRIGEMYPELDERFVMGTKLAEKVLHRKVPSQEFAEKKNSEEFWLVISNSECGSGDVISRKAGACSSLLNCDGMVRWGVRRQVKFIGRHMEYNPQSSSSIVRGSEKAKGEGNEEEAEKEAEEEEEEEGNEEDEDEEEEAVTEETNETKQSGKTRRYSSRLVPKAKKAKREKPRPINKNNKAKNKCKQIIALKNPQDRWSTERYKLAEKNLLEVMKAKGAVYANPILRPSLRSEARKRIGDTGLLDHLLKHMAGKVAPGGVERFRRRHNAEGAMEYWLESADLVDIRRVAGVQDPYWTPPPGWKPGDCPTQDPVCAKELKQLKEETSRLERDMEEMVTKKRMEEELAKLRKEMEELFSSKAKRQQESQAMGITNPSVTSQKLDLDTSSLMVPLKSELENYKLQLMAISKYVRGIEEEIGRLKSMVEEGTRSGCSALMESTECCDEKEKKKVEEKGKGLLAEQRQEDQRKTKKTEKEAAERTAAGEAAAEEKAAKIRRLKSGFRICKPQGTFLWPNMVRNHHPHHGGDVVASQVVVQVEDLFVVPTPPSVSSSSASAPPQLPFHHHPAPPPSPVKPLPERRAVKVTASSAVGDTSFSTTATRPTTTTPTTNKNKTTTLINLNEFPTATSGGGGSKKCTFQQQEEGWRSAASGGSCLTNGVENWLALATPTPAPDDSILSVDKIKLGFN